MRRRVRRVSSRQTRYFLLHQRKYPKSVSRGRTPWIPPTQLKCRHSFPASWTGRCGNSFGGLWPCAGLLSVVSSIQLGAWRGCEKRLGGSIGRARAEGQRSVSCFRSTHHPQSCAPFRGSLFGAMPDQAPPWGRRRLTGLEAPGRSPPRELPSRRSRTPGSHGCTGTETPANLTGDRGAEPFGQAPPLGAQANPRRAPGALLPTFPAWEK